MRRLHAASVAGLTTTVAAIAAATLPPPQDPQRPAFRAAADVVFVDVAVRSELGTLVGGLTAADFVLTDNGVRQHIDSVEPVDLPIDLTLIADVSDDVNGSIGRPIGRLDPANFPRQVEEQVRRTAALLRDGDRLRVLASGTYAVEVRPFGPITAATADARYEGPTGGMSSLHDTVAAALLHPVPLDRRHIVIARTKALDTVSALDAEAIRKIAQRSPAMLHVVLMEAANDDAAQIRAFQCANAGFCEAVRRFWVPFQRRSQNVLAEAARLTGGAVHVTEVFTEPSLHDTFRKVLDDFRRSYVLRYSPHGVDRIGWHDIVVTTPRSPGAVVYARRGYAVDPPAAAAATDGRGAANAAAAAAPASTPSRTRVDADTLVAAFDRGDYSAVATSLLAAPDPARLIRDVQALGNLWPAAPGREGAFLLMLAEAGLFSPRDEDRDAAYKLLASHQVVIRHPLEPDDFERHWLVAQLALLQGVMRPELAAPFVTNARLRFPDEPRFILAEAILADQHWRSSGPTPPAALVDIIVAKYDAAIAHRETADEARVRLAGFLHRLGRYDAALARLNAVTNAIADDRPVHFFHQLFRGQALLGIGQLEAAAAAFEEALRIWPSAQSARVGLMHTRLRQGNRDGAAALADTIQTAPADISDPWWRYWTGDYRFFQPAIRRMAEAGR